MSSNNEKRILITGGAGFIGSHLVDAYLKEGFTVGVVDNLSTGKQSNLQGKGLDFYAADILDLHTLEEVFSRFHPSHVSHHAAQVNVRRSLEEPKADAQINIIGILNLLGLSARAKIQQFIFASSGGAIYGENKERTPKNEDDRPVPTSPYAIAKLAAENYVDFYARNYGLNTTTLRYANVYGPRQDPAGEAGVVSQFLLAFSQNSPGVIYGDGSQVRDFISVYDVAKANMLVTSEAKTGLFNIASGKVTSIKDLHTELSKLWSEKTGRPIVQPILKPKIKGEIFWSGLSIKKAAEQLSFRPTVELSEGLSQTIDWFCQPKDEK